jgi:hypothetical protein
MLSMLNDFKSFSLKLQSLESHKLSHQKKKKKSQLLICQAMNAS